LPVVAVHVGQAGTFPGFQSGPAKKISIKVCPEFFIQGSIEKQKPDRDWSGSVFRSGLGSRFRIFNQSLL